MVEITGRGPQGGARERRLAARTARRPLPAGLRPEGRGRRASARRVARRRPSRSTASRSTRRRRYKVATNNFMLAGGDGYAAFRPRPGADRPDRRQAPGERGHGLRARAGAASTRGSRAASSSGERGPSQRRWRGFSRGPGRPARTGRACPSSRRHGRGGRGARRRAHRGTAPWCCRPRPAIFRALRSTPLDRVKAVILGQDPYPTPGDAHGLAFSYVGPRRLPPSLKAILAEMAADLGVPLRRTGRSHALGGAGRAAAQHGADRRGGRAGAHLRLGWSALTDAGGRRSVGAAPGRRLSCSGAGRRGSARR